MNTVAFGARSRRWWILLVLCLSVLLVVVDNTIVNVAGFATAAGIGTDSAYWGPIIASMTLMAAGLALTSSPATDAIMGALPPAKAGAGSAVNDTTRELGGALGVAVVGSVMASVYRTQVLRSMTSLGAPAAAAAAAKQSVVAGLTVAAHLPPALRGVAAQAARQAFVDGLSAGSVVAAAAAATAATAPRGAGRATQETSPPGRVSL